MKNDGKLLLAAFGRFLAYCLLAALPVFVLRQDLLGAGNTLGERSLVELTQTGFLLASSASFAVLAWRCAQERRFALLASAFFMVMLLREQDAWLDVLIGHGAWKLLAVPIALAALVWAAADWRASVGALLRFVSSRAGTLMLLGLAVLLCYSRLFGMTGHWTAVLGDGYVRTVKNAVEETTELLGYTFILAASVHYLVHRLRALRRQPAGACRPFLTRTRALQGGISVRSGRSGHSCAG